MNERESPAWEFARGGEEVVRETRGVKHERVRIEEPTGMNRNDDDEVGYVCAMRMEELASLELIAVAR